MLDRATPTLVRDHAGTQTAEAEFRRGWPTLAASFIGSGLGVSGIAFYAFGEFIAPLSQAFGWSRGDISAALLISSMAQIVLFPLIGRWAERIGLRRAALLSQTGLAIGFALLALTGSNICGFFGAYLAMSILGSGTVPIIWTKAVTSAFNRSRGLALGIALSGTGLVAIITPVLVSHVIADFGWRCGYLSLAGSVLLVGVPMTYVFFHPQRSDAARVRHPAEGALAPALHDSAFWRLMAASFLMAIGVVGMVVHLPLMLTDAGFSFSAAAVMLGVLGYAVVGGRLMLGFLLDRLPPVLVGVAVVSLASVAGLLMAAQWSPYAAVFMLGLCSGADGDLLAFLVSRLFGARSYTAIYGFSLSAFAAGAGIGPILAGMIRDNTGHYAPACYLFAATTAVAAALMATLAPRLKASRFFGHESTERSDDCRPAAV